jgi:hypothetical protein
LNRGASTAATARPAVAPRTPLVRHRVTALAAAAAFLTGCDEQPGERQLSPSRVYLPVGRPIRWNASPAERYGLSASDFAGESATGAGGAEADDAAGGFRLSWVTPPGWTEQPPRQFREANFLVAGDERAECYLTLLPGEAGGLEANVNRWRDQLSLPPLTAAEVASLPRIDWLGEEAVLVDFEGRWSGMSGDADAGDWRVVGLLQIRPGHSRFLKMTGPAEVVGPQVGALRALADSFAFGGGTPSPGSRPVDPVEAPDDPQRSASLSWSTPPGWRRGPAKAMREVTYFAGDAGQVECYVALLDGSGGGLLANVNRWCGQMGAPELTAEDLARLERLPLAGAEGVLVRIERGAGATAAPGQELLIGAVAQLADRALFVKLTGPAAAVEAERDALLAFCRSIEVTR